MVTKSETKTGSLVASKSNSNLPVVLLVEDEQPIRDIIVPWLFRNGLSCREAADGQAAIDLLASGARINLILSNLMLPMVDGFSLLLHVRERYPKIPFAFVTAVHDQEVLEEGVRRGAAGYLLKPFTEDEFLSFIDKVIGKS